MKKSLLVSGIFALLAHPSVQGAYALVLDMVSATPGPGFGAPAAPLASAFPPSMGPPDFIESSISVASGSSFTVVAYLVVDTSGAPLVFDHLGFTMDYAFGSDTATLTAVPGPLAAGGTAAMGATPAPGSSLDVVSSGPVTSGGILTPAVIFPSAPGATATIGGGYLDPAALFAGFGALGAAGPLTVFDLGGMTFTVTGSPGDTATIFPAGIYSPTAGGPAVLAGGGSAIYDGPSGAVVAPIMLTGGTVTIIPEVQVSLILGIAGTMLLLRRRL